RLARAIRAQWRESRPIIKPDELVLGRFGIQSTVFWSEYGALRFDAGLWQRLMDEPSTMPYQLALLEEIRAEWEGNDFAGLVYKEWQRRGLSGRIPGSGLGPWPGHACQQYRLFLDLGAVGMRERIARAREANPGRDAFYDGLLEIVEGVCEFAQAVRAAARGTGGLARDDRCPEHPPATFREAVQTFWLVFYLNGADSCARIDQDLGPYLERDLAAGLLTEEEARELIASLWVRFDEYRSWSAVIGGVDAEGHDACNTFTRLALEATERLQTQAPNLALRVHEGLPDDVLRQALRMIARGGGMPALVNDAPIIESLQARGVSLEDARDYALTGCAQVIVPGRSYGGYEDILLNGLKWLELALHNGFDPVVNEQLGPQTSEPSDLLTFRSLMSAWQTQMRAVCDTCTAMAGASLRVLAEHFPSGLRSLLSYDAVERGLDMRAGGYRYNEGLADVLGLTNLADCLAVIRELVYERGEFTLPELVAILDANWEGHEPLRQRCLREFPKFGNDDPAHDAFVASVHETVLRELQSRPTEIGEGRYNLDIVGWTGHLDWGHQTLASADGRCAYEPLADSCGASQGRDTHGPTALLASAGRLNHSRLHGVVALTVRFTSPQDTEGSVGSLHSLVRTYFDLGGQQLQINVVDNRLLRDAQEHPERYESLVVRVGGFSAYWTRLSPQMQEAIISRTEHVL
ncbi:MAG: hypothetical protein FJX75_26770, partial [Armatimonadetes bacterium]|nr:hypothetical protein [Armatimonadota bacterium]